MPLATGRCGRTTNLKGYRYEVDLRPVLHSMRLDEIACSNLDARQSAYRVR
jgi:hypothetical protein